MKSYPQIPPISQIFGSTVMQGVNDAERRYGVATLQPGNEGPNLRNLCLLFLVSVLSRLGKRSVDFWQQCHTHSASI
jgi:hypothetical protein